MQSASSRIWTRVTVSISYDDNHHTTGSSIETIEFSVNNSALARLKLVLLSKYLFKITHI